MKENAHIVVLLRALAKRFNRAVRSVNVYDYNVCTGELDWREALENTAPPPDRLRYEVRTVLGARHVVLRANDQYLAIEVRGVFAPPPFSVNRPSKLVLAFGGTMTRHASVGPHPVFVEAGHPVPLALQTAPVRDAIKELRLDADDYLHVYGNGVTLYVKPKTAQRLDQALKALVVFASALPALKSVPPSLSELPEQFRPLVPLIRKWGLSDDSDRGERLERASTREIRSLINRVTPLFGDIDAYLNGFTGTLPESAVLLGALAECAAEARLLQDGGTPGKRVPDKRLQPTAVQRKEPPRLKRCR